MDTKKRAKQRQLARAVTLARRQLRRARRALASATRPEDPAAVYAPSWRWTAKLLEQRGHELLASRNVLGHGVSLRRRDGQATDERSLTVFVRKKMTPAELARAGEALLPKRLGGGKRSVRVDVVELGRLVRQATGGDSIGPDIRLRGTLGSFAIDALTLDTVAVTAMHVTGQRRDIPRNGVTSIPMHQPSLRDDPAAPVFGAAVRGTLSGVDACKIALTDPASLDDRIKGIGRIRGWRPVLVPGDKGTAVRLCGIVSGLVSGSIEHPLVSLPQFDLDDAILVDIPTRKGDSGAALVDSDGFVLGYLVGQAGSLRVFSPAGSVFRKLGCDIPTN